MSDLITVNVRIPRSDYALYKLIASQKGISFSQMARECLSERNKAMNSVKPIKSQQFWEIDKYAIKIAGLNPADFSNEAIDETIYGDPHGQKR